MKKLFTFLTLSTILLMGVSCSNSNGPDVPDPSKPITADIAAGGYFGDYKDNGNGNFELLLVAGKLDAEGDLIGAGSALRLDMYSDLAADSNNASLTPGTYNIAESFAKFTIVPGLSDDNSGSTYAIRDANGNITYEEIISGTVEVAKSGSIYTITTKLKTKSGKDLNYLYKGAIAFENYAEEPPLAANIAMGEYFGDYVDNGNGNFVLQLIAGKLDAKDELIGAGSGLMLDMYSDLAADSNNASLMPGTYNIAESFAKFTIVPGLYEGNDDDFSGSIYVLQDANENITYEEIISGTVEVAKSGSIYTITTKLKTKSGKDLNYLYKGAIAFENYAVEPPLPEPDGAFGLYMDMYVTINYDLHFYKGELNQNMDIVGDGYRLFFETFSPDMYEDRYEMPVGIYVAADGADFEDWSFARGIWDGDRVRSSQLMEYKNSVKTAIPILEGSITVERSADTYTITVSVLPEGRDAIEFVYTGTIDFEDMNS